MQMIQYSHLKMWSQTFLFALKYFFNNIKLNLYTCLQSILYICFKVCIHCIIIYKK